MKGLCARGGFVVDIDWKDGKLLKAVIHSAGGTTATARYGNDLRQLHVLAGHAAEFVPMSR